MSDHLSNDAEKLEKLKEQVQQDLNEAREQEDALKKREERDEEMLKEIEKVEADEHVERQHKEYPFFIDKKEYKSPTVLLTARQILTDYAHVNPQSKTLAKKQVGGFHEYKDLDEAISLENAPHFILFDNTPTQVS